MSKPINKILATLTFAIAATSMLADAYARPMGGGRSIGRQSSNVTRQAPAPAPAPSPAANPAARQATPAPAPAPVPPRPSPWKGILGGALLGLGLGALLSHFGLGGAVASMISSLLMLALLALIVYFIYRLFRGKNSAQSNNGNYGFGGNQPLPQGAGGFTPEIGSRVQPSAFEPVQNLSAAPGVSIDKPAPVAAPAQWGVPADFDEQAFLRHAKTNFIRLQAAWDKADVNDIREFTTPEVYAELKMQIQERGPNADFTDVVSIDAALMGIETVETGPVPEYLASVKFSGLIRSAPGAAAEPFAEVWNMSKPVSGTSGWVLAGIQQLS
jgi:predicted lipid-binding transport protein (Tim44 family)